MDIIDSSYTIIDKQLEEISRHSDELEDSHGGKNEQLQSQIEAVVDRDKNIDRILDQQSYVKMIIEEDNLVVSLNKSIASEMRAIDSLRKSCAKLEREALKNRQELLETQAKELERFQLQQLKSIAEDYKRHQDILETRKREILGLKRETENEEKNRASYLVNLEKDLEKELQSRKQMRQGKSNDLSILAQSTSHDPRNPDQLELESIDEYAPYGVAPHSRVDNIEKRANTTRKRGRGRGK